MNRKHSQTCCTNFVATALAAMLFVLAAGTAHAARICDNTDLFAHITTCPNNSNPCVIQEEILCDTGCAGNCTYDLGDRTVEVKSITSPTTSHGKFTSSGRTVTVKAKIIKTDTSTTQVRFSGQITLDTTASTHLDTDNFNDVEINGKIQGAPIHINGGKVKVKAITSSGGNIQIFAMATSNGQGKIEVAGTLDASSTYDGGAIWLLADRTITINASVLTRLSANGTPGSISLTTNGFGTGASRPNIDINALVSASAVSGNANGGTIWIMRNGYTWTPGDHPIVNIAANLTTDASGTGCSNGCDGGTVTISAWKVLATAGTIDSSGSGSSSNGGTMDITALAPDEESLSGNEVLALNALTSRGATGGTINLKADGDVLVSGRVNLTSLDQSPRKGGTLDISPNEGIPCGQQVVIDDDVDAYGYSASGQGGTIDIEGGSIWMNEFTVHQLSANSRSLTNPTTGTGGTVNLRSSEGTDGIVLHVGNMEDEPANWHIIRALPGGQIHLSDDVHGGDFAPTPSYDLDYLPCDE